MKKNSNRIVLFNIASTVVLQGLNFFCGPVFSSMLGPNNYGIASVYLTWVQIASAIFSLQAGETIAIARAKFSLEDQPKYQSSVLFLATISYWCFSILTVAIAFIASKWVHINMVMLLCGLVHGWGLYCISFVNSKFIYEFKAEKNFILSVSVSALTIGLSIFMIWQLPKENNYWGRIIGQTVVYGILGTVMFFYIIKNGKTLYDKEYWRFTLPIAVPTIFHVLASTVLGQSDKVMIQSILNNSYAGIYAIASTFGALINTIWMALNKSWVPFYYEYTRQNQIAEMRDHVKKYIELFTILVIGFMLLSPEVFHVYANKDFWDGTNLIPLFAIGYYFVFLYSFPANYEFYNKKTKTIAYGTTLAAICNIVLNYFLIKLCGIIGAVIATVVAHAFQFFFHFLKAKRIKPEEFPFCMIDFIPGLLCIFGAYILCFITKDFWMIRWGVGIMLGALLVIKIIKRKEIF